MSDQRPLGAQISHMLKDRGVEVIFGIPGVHNQEMYRGIADAGITHILARHEQGAGFMADGYARATGEPGIAYVITGPGLTNIMTPMGQAYSDSVPLLVLSSCLDETAATRGQLHQMKDQRLAAECVADWSEEARTATAAYTLIDRALMEFETQRPRPKHIQVPIAQLESLADPAPLSKQPVNPDGYEDPPHLDVMRPQASQNKLAHIAERLIQAKRPIFVIGGGLAEPGVQRVMSRMLDRFGAAAFTTYAGRGIVAPDYPLLFGSFLARPDSADVLASSDCVVVLGTDMAEVDLWRTETGIQPGAGIHVNTDPAVLSKAHPQDTRLQLDAMDFLFFLPPATKDTSSSTWTAADVATSRSRWRAEVCAERPMIVAVADALRDAIPDDTMIYSDMTQFAYAAKEIWDMPKPGHWHHPTGFGTLGYALPAAIGGAVGRPDQPTLAIAGDYGIQYTIQELGTAVELGQPLPIVVWDNGKLGEIEASMVSAQIAPNAVVAHNPDFLALARAYGAAAAQPKSASALRAVLHQAFEAPGPTVIVLTQEFDPQA
ncbi:MAG: thiamine pyrophosphate-binding protein [Pseudomonadota bacterium]